MNAARAIVPILAEHAARTEHDRRVADPSVEAARKAGAFALGTPHELGGYEASVALRFEVLSELGRGCPSTSWIAATTAGVKIPLPELASEQVLAEAFAEPHSVLCASARPGRAVPVPGGVRVSGRWGYASGCEHATGALLVVQHHEANGGTRAGAVFVPTAELTIDRDWDMAGLVGTGSHTLVADSLFVPDSHVLELSGAQAGSANLAISLDLFAPLLGAARAGLDLLLPAMTSRVPPGTSLNRLADSAGARQWFAEANHLVTAAHRSGRQVAERLDAAQRGEPLFVRARAQSRMEILDAVRQCRHAFDNMLDLQGSSAFRAGNSLQRLWRDFAVGSRHVSLSSYVVADDYGRLLTGSGESTSTIL